MTQAELAEAVGASARLRHLAGLKRYLTSPEFYEQQECRNRLDALQVAYPVLPKFSPTVPVLS